MNNLTGRLTALLLCAVMIGCFFVSCGEAAEPDSTYITFCDSLGYEVTLSDKPSRTAALVGSFADMWVLAGGELCAAPEDAFEDFGLSDEGVTNIGGAHSPSAEMLLSSDPDFVIASASTAADLELRDILTDAGIPVAYFDVDSFYDYLSVLEIMTEITDRRDLYKLYGSSLRTETERIKTELSRHLTDGERKILLLRASSGFVKAKGSEGTVLGEMLMDLGFINIADSDETLLEKLSAESIIKDEPYRIFCVAMGNDSDAAMASLEKLLSENPAFAELSAVNEGRVHIMDKSLFNLKPNDRWAEAYGEIYDIITSE